MRCGHWARRSRRRQTHLLGTDERLLDGVAFSVGLARVLQLRRRVRTQLRGGLVGRRANALLELRIAQLGLRLLLRLHALLHCLPKARRGAQCVGAGHSPLQQHGTDLDLGSEQGVAKCTCSALSSSRLSRLVACSRASSICLSISCALASSSVGSRLSRRSSSGEAIARDAGTGLGGRDARRRRAAQSKSWEGITTRGQVF